MPSTAIGLAALAMSFGLAACANDATNARLDRKPTSQEAAIDQDIAAGHYNGPDALSLGRSLRVEPPGYSPWPTN